MKIRVLQIIAGLHRQGGTTTFVGGLSNALADRRHEVTIATFRERNREDECPLDDAVKVSSIKDVTNHPSDFDVMHVHGLWDKDVFWATGWALKHGIPLIWSPHGMLAPWALKHRWWKKFLPWHLYLHRRLKHAAALHVTTPLESDWIHALGFFNRIAIVPLGTYLPPADSSYTRTIEQSEQSNNSRILLFVGRLHPVKGLDNLLDAWKTIPADAHWRLRLVGLVVYPFLAVAFVVTLYMGWGSQLMFTYPFYSLLCFAIGMHVAQSGKSLFLIFQSKWWLLPVAIGMFGLCWYDIRWHWTYSPLRDISFMLMAPFLFTTASWFLCLLDLLTKWNFVKNSSFFLYTGHFLFCSMVLHTLGPLWGFWQGPGKLTFLIVVFCTLGVAVNLSAYWLGKRFLGKIFGIFDGTL